MPDVAVMSRDDVVRAMETGRPLTLAPADRVVAITWTRAPAPDDWLADEEDEAPLADHRAAHAGGRPSEAVVRYGAGTDPGAVADRLLGLAALGAESDLLRAVCPVPGEGDETRPGSWGVEDLTMIALARRLMPGVPWIRPCWRLLGPAACQVAVGFGANDWRLPPDDPSDPDHLAEAIGCRAVAR